MKARPTTDDVVNNYKVVDQNEGLVDTAFALGIYVGSFRLNKLN